MGYFPVGCMFSMTSYLQFVIFSFISADVFKVLEQSRLLVTALLSFMFLGRPYSIASWCTLVMVTLASISYGEISQLESAVDSGHSKTMASSNFFVGSMLTALFVVIQCGASVYAELWLKQDRHIPYFIQKFYLETSGLAFALFITLFLDGWMVRAGLSAERGGL